MSPPTKVETPAPSTTTSSQANSKPESNSEPSATYKKPHKTFSSLYHSKFRHLSGAPLHRSQYIENVRGLSTSMFGECDGFQTNSKRAAIPLEGPGGKIAVLEVGFCRLFVVYTVRTIFRDMFSFCSVYKSSSYVQSSN